MALPMHGEIKMRAGGLRTRDAHLLEWLATPERPALVISRAEPWPRLSVVRRSRPMPLHGSWHLKSPEPLALPRFSPGNTRRWWVEALRWQPAVDPALPLIGWNPFGLARVVEARRPGLVAFDLLDDWTTHYAFAGLRQETEAAYLGVFERADIVIANSEGTADLARRFDRPDVLTLPNGVDPGRFCTTSTASGSRTVVGYAGKIGSRLDLDAVETTARALPACSFVFAGPVLERAIGRRLARLPNVRMLGDIHYERYPSLLQTWDIGWVPHRVGSGEVGGDAIKTYEYRAAGLPTVTTPIIGAHRLPAVAVVPGADLPDAIAAIRDRADGPRVPRRLDVLPSEHSWAEKAVRVSGLLFPTRRQPAPVIT